MVGLLTLKKEFYPRLCKLKIEALIKRIEVKVLLVHIRPINLFCLRWVQFTVAKAVEFGLLTTRSISLWPALSKLTSTRQTQL